LDFIDSEFWIKQEMSLSDFNMQHFALNGKNAIVTGGNGGLGKAFSVALAKAGANIHVVSLADDNQETQNLVRNCGVKYEYCRADLTRQGECKRAVDECHENWGHVDILINCAGIGINVKDVTQFKRKHWDEMIAVNLTAAFEMTHEVCTHMIRQKGGKIINIASLYSFLGGRWSPAYAATKHGIVGLTKTMCDELAEHNIQVNAIAPGYFKTPLTQTTQQDSKRNAEILANIPANRWGCPSDLMGAAIFLASPASDYVNGSVISVDGGFLVR